MEGLLFSQSIYFVPYSSTELKSFNCDTSEILIESSPCGINLPYGPHLVPVSENKLFIQGGIFDLEVVANCFVYDAVSKTFETKASGRSGVGGACVKYNMSVFIFGGAASDELRPSELSQSFNLENENWEMVAPLPVASYNNNCVLMENQILIVGLHLKNILYYSPLDNSYRDGIEVEHKYKILLKHESDLFMVLGNTTRALENGEWKDYTNKCTQVFSTIYSYSVYKNGYIYFVAPALDLARLNTETKVVEIIGNFSPQ